MNTSPEIIDSEGRKWRLIVTMGVYVKLRDEENIDLLNEKSLSELMIDPVKRSEVLIAILDRQATKLGLKSDDVDEILCDPKTSPPAHVALEAALRDFYQTQSALVMLTVIDRVSAAQKTLNSTAIDRMNSPAMNRVIQREVTKASQQMDKAIAEMEAKQIADDGSTNSLPSQEQTIGMT